MGWCGTKAEDVANIYDGLHMLAIGSLPLAVRHRRLQNRLLPYVRHITELSDFLKTPGESIFIF